MRASFVALILNFIMIFNLININLNVDQNSFYDESQLDNINLFTSGLESYTLEWIDNGEFDPPVTEWYNETDGDLTDINASLSNNHANLELLGDIGHFSTDVIESYPNETQTWKAFNNSRVFPQIDDVEQFGIDTEGWWCSHEWSEGGGASATTVFPSVQFKKNYTIDSDLSDYEITEIYLNSTINGTVQASDVAQDGGVDRIEDDAYTSFKDYAVGDYVYFYIMVENYEGSHQFECASYQTTTLGRDDLEDIFHDHSISGINLNVVDDNVLISYLGAIFANTAYDGFTITLGIDIYCEDNFQDDQDLFHELRFNNFCFNFTYEKKMNRYASVAWSQEGNQVPSGSDIQVDYATLEFDVKSNKNFTADSPNSEVQVLINGNKFVETIKLDDLNDTFDHVVFDLTPLITKGINLTTSIRLMLLDNFILNETFRISIDNVSLEIKYSIIAGLESTDFDLYLERENKTLPKSIEIEIGELVNISFNYRDSSDVFIENATVELTGYGSIKTLTNTSVLEIYNITIDTTYMSLGENYLTLTASKVGYVDQEIVITIDVVRRTAIMSIFLNQDNKTDDRSIYITSGYPLNITVMLKDSITEDFVGNVSVKVINGDPDYTWTKTLAENSSYEYYSIVINSSIDMGTGITFLALLVEHENYTSLTADLTISTSARKTYYKLIIDGNDLTNEPSYKITVGYELNVTFQYFDDEFNSHIPYANISLLGGGVNVTLKESITNNRYTKLINASEFNAAVNFLTIFAQKAGYQPLNPLLTLEIEDVATNMEVVLNGEDVTNTTYYEIPYGGYLNFSIRYFNTSHINGAQVNLRHGGTLLGSLNETGGRYNISINTVSNANLDIGLSILTIEAIKSNYQTQTANLRINVKQIRSEIYPEDGKSAITASYLQNVVIRIKLRDLDFGTNITGATVIFTSNIPRDDLSGGTFVEVEPGVYQVVLNSVPAGTFILTITVLGGGEYDNYDFSRYDMALSVKVPPENVLFFQIITGIAIGAVLCVGGYLIAYQKVLKYPKPVRKVHKTKKMIKRNKFKDLDILDREAAFNALYEEELHGQTKYLKQQQALEAEQEGKNKLQGLKNAVKDKSSELKEKVKGKVNDLK